MLGKIYAFNWTIIVALIAVITAICWIISLWRSFREDSNKESLFYLEQIKSYFTKAQLLISDCGNNNVKWHQAVELLKTADALRNFLKNEAHQRIYYSEYMNTSFGIIEVIAKIDDYRFFYGIANYKTVESVLLFEQSYPTSLEGSYTRISVQALLILSVFIDKANNAFQDVESNGADWMDVFNSEYFKVPLRKSESILDITKQTTLKIVFDYIANFEINKNKRRSQLSREPEESLV